MAADDDDDNLLHITQAPRAEFFKREGDRITRLAREGQHPQAMLIACADSRVMPESLFGARPGDLYVVRTIANIVPPFGTAHEGAGAALEHAIHHLDIGHIIICGHTECGGLKALDSHVNALQDPAFGAWLRYAREAQTRVDRRGIAPDKRHRAIVEQNILLQLEHVSNYPAVYTALKARRLELHGWLFDLHGPQVYAYNPKTQSFETR